MRETTRLLLVRHGEVEEGFHRTFGGTIDMGLSTFGATQAAQTAGYLAGRLTIDKVYSSPMRRVRETIDPLVSRADVPDPVFSDHLREVDFGVWTGLRWEEVAERHGASAFDWLKHLEAESIPEAEPVSHFRERVSTALEMVVSDGRHRTNLVACHGGVIRMALSILLDIPLLVTERFEVDYASVTVVDIFPEKTDLQLLNHTPWRPLI